MKLSTAIQLVAASGVVALAFVTAGCTVENVIIRERSWEAPGSAVLFGEVKNNSGAYAAQVQVKGSLFDAGGTVVASPTSWVCPTIIKPWDSIPFAISYIGPSPVADYDLHVESIPTEPVPDANLRVSDLRTDEDEHDRVHVLGLITNTGAERYEHVLVCVAFFDSSGKVDGFLLGYAPDVDPAQRAFFDVFSSPMVEGGPSSNAVTYRVWVQPGLTAATGYAYRGYVSTDKLPF